MLTLILKKKKEKAENLTFCASGNEETFPENVLNFSGAKRSQTQTCRETSFLLSLFSLSLLSLSLSLSLVGWRERRISWRSRSRLSRDAREKERRWNRLFLSLSLFPLRFSLEVKEPPFAPHVSNGESKRERETCSSPSLFNDAAVWFSLSLSSLPSLSLHPLEQKERVKVWRGAQTFKVFDRGANDLLYFLFGSLSGHLRGFGSPWY